MRDLTWRSLQRVQLGNPMQSKPAYIVDADSRVRLNLYEQLSARGWRPRPFISGTDFLEELPHLPVGIVLMDIGSAGKDGFDVIECVAKSQFACPIIAMTASADVHVAVAAMRRGAIDFLVKPIDEDELESALEGVVGVLEHRRGVYEQLWSDEARLALLTPRERQILRSLAQGDVTKVIAEHLSIGIRTVEAHRAAIVEKLGVPNSVAAVAIYARHQGALQAHAARVSVAAGE